MDSGLTFHEQLGTTANRDRTSVYSLIRKTAEVTDLGTLDFLSSMFNPPANLLVINTSIKTRIPLNIVSFCYSPGHPKTNLFYSWSKNLHKNNSLLNGHSQHQQNISRASHRVKGYIFQVLQTDNENFSGKNIFYLVLTLE